MVQAIAGVYIAVWNLVARGMDDYQPMQAASIPKADVSRYFEPKRMGIALERDFTNLKMLRRELGADDELLVR